jgi:hypothetical protein
MILQLGTIHLSQNTVMGNSHFITQSEYSRGGCRACQICLLPVYNDSPLAVYSGGTPWCGGSCISTLIIRHSLVDEGEGAAVARGGGAGAGGSLLAGGAGDQKQNEE